MTLKLKYDEDSNVFRAHKALPVGFTFPFNFGFVAKAIAGEAMAIRWTHLFGAST